MSIYLRLNDLDNRVTSIQNVLNITNGNLTIPGSLTANANGSNETNVISGYTTFKNNQEYSGISLFNQKDTTSSVSISFIDFRNYNFISDSSIFASHEVDGRSNLIFYTTAPGSKTEDRRANEIVFSEGNIYFLAQKGISFSNTSQLAGMTSELFNDYEEGTWTPSLNFGGAAVGITYTTRDGKYTKIGNYVFGTGIIELSNKGSSTGTAYINDLPYTVSGRGYLLVHAATNGNFSPVSAIMGPLYNGNNNTDLQYTMGAAGGSIVVLNTNFTNTTRLEFSFGYHTSS
jgi:hypothetical protein